MHHCQNCFMKNYSFINVSEDNSCSRPNNEADMRILESWEKDLCVLAGLEAHEH